MESRRYLTDLSDHEWRCIGPHLPEPTGQGRPRLHGLQAILNAVFYVLKSGCPWRLLPKDFPPWKTVYDWFSGAGVSTAPSSARTLSCAIVYGVALAGTRTPALA